MCEGGSSQHISAVISKSAKYQFRTLFVLFCKTLVCGIWVVYAYTVTYIQVGIGKILRPFHTGNEYALSQFTASVLSQVESYLRRSRQAYSVTWPTTAPLRVKHTTGAGCGHLPWFSRQTKDFPYCRSPNFSFINVMPTDNAFKNENSIVFASSNSSHSAT